MWTPRAEDSDSCSIAGIFLFVVLPGYNELGTISAAYAMNSMQLPTFEQISLAILELGTTIYKWSLLSLQVINRPLRAGLMT